MRSSSAAEAEAARAFVFLHQRVDCRRRAALAQRGGRVVRAVARGQAAERAAAAHEGRRGQLRQFLQALVQHAREQAFDQLLAVAADGGALARRAHRVADQDRGRAGFLVGDDQRFGRRARRDLGVAARTRRGRVLQAWRSGA
jgi:hypothetical protein